MPLTWRLPLPHASIAGNRSATLRECAHFAAAVRQLRGGGRCASRYRSESAAPWRSSASEAPSASCWERPSQP